MTQAEEDGNSFNYFPFILMSKLLQYSWEDYLLKKTLLSLITSYLFNFLYIFILNCTNSGEIRRSMKRLTLRDYWRVTV